jgi:hypothetical protein
VANSVILEMRLKAKGIEPSNWILIGISICHRENEWKENGDSQVSHYRWNNKLEARIINVIIDDRASVRNHNYVNMFTCSYN